MKEEKCSEYYRRVSQINPQFKKNDWEGDFDKLVYINK